MLGLGYIVYWREVQTARLGIAGMADEHEREEYCESYFAFIEFLHWMYMSAEYEQRTRGLNLAPIAPQISNKVVGKLWGSSCDGKRWKHVDSEIVVSVDTELTGATLDVLSFFYHRHSPDAVVITQSLAGTRPSLLTIKRTSAVEAAEILAGERPSKTHAWLPLWSTPLAVVCSLGVAGLRVALQVNEATLAKILEGRITHWQHPDIQQENGHLPLPNRTITLVGHTSLIDPVAKRLGLRDG